MSQDSNRVSWSPIATACTAGAVRKVGPEEDQPTDQEARDPNQTCISRLKQLTFALRMYSEDYDGRLPPMKKSAQAEGPISAYVRFKSRPIFACPVTKAPYRLNAALSGKLITAVKNKNVLLSDSQPHPDGLWTVGHLDGTISREKRRPK